MPRTRRLYPSELTDQEWNVLEPLLASPERRGRPPKWPARRIADAVFYLLRSGCAWRMLPREYPPWQTVYYHFLASGASTDGCAKPTIGCVKRCARRRVARGTRAGR
jgi:transposase